MTKVQKRLLMKAIAPLVQGMVISTLESLAAESQPRRGRRRVVEAEVDTEEEDDSEYDPEDDEDDEDEENGLDEGDLEIHHEDDEDGEDGEDDDDDDDTEECGPMMKKGMKESVERQNGRLKRQLAVRDLADRLGIKVDRKLMESVSKLPAKDARVLLERMADREPAPRGHDSRGDEWADQFLEGVAQQPAAKGVGRGPTLEESAAILTG